MKFWLAELQVILHLSCYKKTGDIPRTVKEGTISGPRSLHWSNYRQNQFLKKRHQRLSAEENIWSWMPTLNAPGTAATSTGPKKWLASKKGFVNLNFSSIGWPLFLPHSYSIPCSRLDSTMETILTTSLPGTPRIARWKLSKDQPNIDRCLFYRLVVRRMWAVSHSPFTQAMPSVIWREQSSTESKMLR